MTFAVIFTMVVDCTAALLTIWFALRLEYREKITVKAVFWGCSCIYVFISLLGIFEQTDTNQKIMNEYNGYSYLEVNNEIIAQLINNYKFSIIKQSIYKCVLFAIAIVLLCLVLNNKNKMKNKLKHILATLLLLFFTLFVIIPTSYTSIQKYSFRDKSAYETRVVCFTVYKDGIPEISYRREKIVENNKPEFEIIDVKEFNFFGAISMLFGMSIVFATLALSNRLTCKEANAIEIELEGGNYHEKQI